MDAADRFGLIFVERMALLRVRQGAVSLVDVARGQVYRAEGRFASEILSAVKGGGSGATLAALGAEHPLSALIQELSSQTPLPLERRNAVELDGYDTLFIELLGRCNERCLHCYASAGPEIAAELEPELCAQLIEDAVELGFRRVQFTGGDPLLHSALPKLASDAAKRGLHVEIYTNGLALSERLLKDLLPARPSFAFSFYSHREAVHDAITQCAGSQQRTLRAIERALAFECPVRVAMVVMPQNAEDVEPTLAFLKARGVSMVSTAASHGVGRGQYFGQSYSESIGFAHRASPSASAAAVVSSSESPSLSDETQLPEGKLCVTYEGDVVPCIFNREMVLGNVRKRRLAEIARHPDPLPARVLSLEQLVGRCQNQLSCYSCRLTACALSQTERSA